MDARNRTKPARARKSPLKDYAGKRDFNRTAEPKPQPAPKRRGKAAGLQFVVQKHAARRTHYDLRLELDGVLKSWAVTRGPSLAVGDKRLAVRTEDHPMQYLDFEGNIPKGEYGGGAMIVWDRGRWTPDGDPHRGLDKGHLQFMLEGTRLKGRWHLVRIRPRPGERTDPWLLIKSEDEFARPAGASEIVAEETTSYLSGLTTEELTAKGALRADHAARVAVAKERTRAPPDVARVRGARKKLLPAFVAPSLAQTAERPPTGPKWVHEIKHDGYRIQARIDGSTVKLMTRTGLDWTDRFASIAKALGALGLSSALLDGEIVVEDSDGIAKFGLLQADLSAGRQDRFVYYLFDLLYAEGYDLTPATLLDRKALLHEIVAGLPSSSPVRFSEHLAEDGPTMLEHACRLGLEGIVSKRVDMPYRSGRSEHWLKSKSVLRQEFIIIGYVPSTVAPGSVGALLLGYHENGKLMYAGRVGTGYSHKQAKELRETLETIAAPRPALGNALPAGAEKGVRWAAPQLVCDVEFHDWTADRLLRQSSFKGLREDKSPEEVVLETRPESATGAPELTHVRLTHPERILWEGPGITKQGLAEFYADIAEWILPHIAGRVLSLVRCPSGIGGQHFFAKHPWHGLDPAVRRVDVGEKEPMLVVENLTGLLALVQASVVEIHPWGSTADDLDRPDRLIFDLDPDPGLPWSAVIAAALEVRERLARLGLESFVKTSGGKGLHVVLPIEPQADWDAAKEFTGALAAAMAKDTPDRYVATMSKRARQGRVFVDFFRNGRGSTAVGACSTRALPDATVSTPLDWSELSASVRADHFRIDNLRQRLAVLKADPWAEMLKLRQRLPIRRAR
ncbi:MAG TPA: DNA ligase D [Xanthobacteraceae bacterium]|nr:DNA ligase D [Xanthobacteraceae bacterium]